jgi:hypothetical protein
MDDAVGDHPGLAAARSCEHQERALKVLHGSTLRFGQAIKK